MLIFEENDAKRAAHDFFSALRDLDREGTELIIAGALDTKDQIGFAVMNRMIKSAGYNVIKLPSAADR